jgi:hypothetical protein
VSATTTGDLFAQPESHEGWATFSECGLYRYVLGRAWGQSLLPRDAYVLLNPSNAGADYDDNDPTVRKTIGFSQRNGARSLVIVNPNAIIATNPAEVRAMRRRGVNVCGEHNWDHVRCETSQADRVIVGWGAGLDAASRGWILKALEGRELWCIGTTRSGEPRHPLMTAYATPITRWPVPR